MNSKPSFRFFVLTSFFCFTYAVVGQSILESWSPPTYQSSAYSEFYGNLYFSNSLDEWESKVHEVLYLSMGEWEENANRIIEQILSEEKGEDSFVSNEGYLDERRRSLVSEISVFYSAWERDLLDDYFDNRNVFLEKLETGKIDVLYFTRIGQEALYEDFTSEELAIAENRNQILESAKEWEFQWDQTRQEGLDSFANSISQLENDYQSYVQSLANTENQFSENLNAINSYKDTVKVALREIVAQLKTGLDSSCSVSTGCQYKNYDGTYNEAGRLFSKFIGDLSLQLNQSEIDPDSILTSISTQMKEFLSGESSKAFSEYTIFKDQIYTYQTGFQIQLNQSKSNFDLAGAEWRLRNQTYHELSADFKYENWLSGGFGEIGTFSGIYDLEMQGIFQSIHHEDYGRLISIINNKLGSGRRVQSLVSANLYTDAFHFINNEKIGDFYVPFAEAFHTNGNLLLDGKKKYGYWVADRHASVISSGRFNFQMGAIAYSLLYEMYDENSSQSSLYWKDNYSQLDRQSNHFQTSLLPAVSHWESKVKEYSNRYEEWKENKNNLLVEATAKLEANRLEIERSKETWLKSLDEEKHVGLKSWAELYEAGELKANPTPSISAWKPNLKKEEFSLANVMEFQSLANFGESIEGIQIGGNGLLQEFHKTITGVGQYASFLQMNRDLEQIQSSEQKKLINQMSYSIQWELLGGRELTKEERILLGNYDSSQLTEAEQIRFGSCYENPNVDICKNLLKKEYDVTIDDKNGVLTLKKEIYNGLLAGKNAEGQYNAGKTEEIRQIQLSSIGKLNVPNGNSFFTTWSDEDWATLFQKKADTAQSFLANSLQRDKHSIHSNMNSIQEKNNRNKDLFQIRKESQENADSLVQELAVAYFTGGASGMRASLKGKLDSAVNNEIAKAWITATGGSESDIQIASMMVDFMQGRRNARKIKSRDQYISVKNPIQAIEKILTKTVSTTLKVADIATLGLSTVTLNITQAPVMAMTKLAIGERQYDKLNDQMAGTSKRLEEIKANEQMLIQNGISMAVSQSTGIPTEAISKMLGDKYGQQKAKKANKAMAKNPIFDIGSQVVGALGGMLKTAIVACGIPEDEIQSILEDTNGIINAGNLNRNTSSQNSFGYALQAMGMQAGWTKHQSSYLNLRDSKAVVEELGKKALAKEIAKSLGMDESVIGQIVNSNYSSYQKQKSDKKARSNAARQTVVNAASIALTLGASGMLTGVNSALSSIGKAVSTLSNGLLPATTQIGQAVASTFLQTIAGSQEGPKGALAGFANGVLGGITQGMGKIQSGYFKGMVPGVGVTYSDQNGWGGSFGIGNAISNVSLSFSEKGNTSLQASKSLGGGVQLAADVTTNGAANIGFNYNPTGKGTRTDWNYSMMYDLNGGGFSGSIGYTDPISKLGLKSSVDKNGISTSSELQGIILGTNSDDGFEMSEMNFAEQNINAAQDVSDSGDGATGLLQDNDSGPFTDFATAAGTMGTLLLSGIGLGLGLRNRFGGGLSNFIAVGSDSGSLSIGASSGNSILGNLTNPFKSGLLRFGEVVSKFADGFTIEKNTNNKKNLDPDVKQKTQSEQIKKIEASIIDDYSKDSRIDTEKKLYELRKAGADTTEIEKKLKKLRGDKDVPIPAKVEKELKEYIRLREGSSLYPLNPEATTLVSSTEALARINLNHDTKKETNAAYLKRLGKEISEASQNVDLSTKELVTEHAVNVAKLLGKSLKGKISYDQYKIIDGKKDVSAVNPVDANGFRAVDGLDCIRFIGAVLNASGITTNGSFANLNTELYQMPDEMKNMDLEYGNRNAHYNGVEYFRQASNFMTLVSDRITTSQDLTNHKTNFQAKELSVGLIGITRANENLPDSKISAVKSDHVYMITDKRFNQELGIFEYQIAESRGKVGVSNPWIRTESNQALELSIRKTLKTKNLSKQEINSYIKNALKASEESSYLKRSEFYELKPQVRKEVTNEV
ncbi:TIGR04388 family protein [Leptospira mtsangambouensis]|uniref:TIGR04388 family protein n=1 Tax=Leptospira mtsangambouensis TaxID=2484912 RepID=UPI001EEBDDD8|nr:TIGR04388 family protein [Leptospira mtsangambouensis]MCG6139714.1 TIGR04388 family protein [Leptospira mtsangambouensis]